MPTPATADVVVIGAGVVGAACAFFAARAGLRVAVVDRGPVAGGTTGAGEGNLLVSDKGLGPELDLALHSLALWDAIPDPDAFEREHKGGLVVASTADGLAGLHELAEQQRAVGVRADEVTALRDYEPNLTGDLTGGLFYPQDMQVQPMLAAAHLLRLAIRDHGASLHTSARVTAIERTGGVVSAVHTTAGRIATPAVVNAAGTWSGEIAALGGVDLPILPRRTRSTRPSMWPTWPARTATCRPRPWWRARSPAPSSLERAGSGSASTGPSPCRCCASWRRRRLPCSPYWPGFR
jgi:glycine/D-amino acid oxidase-like deaminating enzyme